MRKQYILGAMLIAGILFFSGCNVVNPKEKEELSYRQVGIQYIEKGDYENAVKALQKALDQANGRISRVEIDICFYKALAYVKMGNNEEARKIYKALLDIDGKNAEAYLQRGNLSASEKDFKSAIADYEKAIAINSGTHELYMAIYRNLTEAGADKTQAENYLRRALQLSDESGEDYCNKGKIYYLLQEYDKAKQFLSQAENEGDEEARLYMARVYEAAGEKKQAYAIYESYDKSHKDGFAKMRLITLILEQKEYGKALGYINEAKELVEEDTLKELLQYEVIALEKSGNKPEAKKALEEYLRTYPDDQKAKRELKFLNYVTES